MGSLIYEECDQDLFYAQDVLRINIMVEQSYRTGLGTEESDVLYLNTLKSLTHDINRLKAISWAIRKHYCQGNYALIDSHLDILTGSFMSELAAIRALKMILESGHIRRQLSPHFEARIAKHFDNDIDTLARWMTYFHQYTQSKTTTTPNLPLNIIRTRKNKKPKCCHLCS